MKKYFLKTLASTIILMALISCTENKDVVTIVKSDVASIENQFVQVGFKLETGEYFAFDKRDGKVCISAASFKVNNKRSNDGYKFSCVEEVLSDELELLLHSARL